MTDSLEQHDTPAGDNPVTHAPSPVASDACVVEALTVGMYDHSFDEAQHRYINCSTRFGIRCGAILTRDLAHNANWLNVNGDKLGWGDLSATDMVNIAEGLAPDETFIVAAERLFWKSAVSFPKSKAVGRFVSEVAVDRDAERHPPLEMIAEHLRYMITAGKIAEHLRLQRARNRCPQVETS